MASRYAEKLATISYAEFFKRLYGRTFPRPQELVIGRVVRIEKHGIYIYLDEYDLEAYVPLKELSTKLVNHPREIVKLYQRIVARVYKADPHRRIVNASLRRVLPSERDRKLQEWRKMRRSLMILQQIANALGVSLEEVLEKIGKPLFELYDTIYDGFEAVVKWGDEVLREINIPEEWIPTVTKILKENIKPKELEIRFTILISTLAPDGISRIKRAFKEALQVAPDKIFAEYISSPRYLIKVKGYEWKEIRDTFEEFFSKLKEIILKNNKWPTEVSYEIEDKKLKAKAKKAK